MLFRSFVKFWTTSCEKLSTEDCAEAVIVLADNRISEIFQETIQIMKQSFVQEWMHEKFFDSLDRVMLEANEGRNSLGIKLKELDDKTDLVNYWIYRNSLKISAARKRLREREAIRIMCDPNIARAQSTADYALIKQLQNYWLLKNSDMKTGRDLQPRIAKQTISHITRACPRFCVNGLMAGSCRSSQRKRNDRKQRIDRPPAGGLQKA